MSIQNIHLWRLLRLLEANDRQRRSLLLADIRADLRKRDGGDSGGGDFHLPFWRDARDHAAGELDLRMKIPVRVGSNRCRERLYPVLSECFLQWWEDLRRWRNLPLSIVPQPLAGRYQVPGLVVVKMERLLWLRVGEQEQRIVYPYFTEDPVLSPDIARIGLAVLQATFSFARPEDFHLLDVLRGKSWSNNDAGLRGNEFDLLKAKFTQLIRERAALAGGGP